MRRTLVENGLRLLIRKGLVEKKFTESGIYFAADKHAQRFLEYLTSEYAKRCKEISKWIAGQFQALTLEHAIRKITFELASFWGLQGRGMLCEGNFADVVIFNPETISPTMPTLEYDLPGGARRLKQKSVGIKATIVNGEVLLRNNDHTGALPGKLLRGPLAATA